MRATWQKLVIAVFFAAIVLVGTIGTAVSGMPLWLACGVLGLVALLSLGLGPGQGSPTLPRGLTLCLWAAGAYVLLRALNSPVTYFAREDLALFAGGFLVYALCLYGLDQAVWQRRFLYLFALLAAVQLALVSGQFLHDWGIGGGRPAEGVAEPFSGLFQQRDLDAGFLAVLVPLWLVLASSCGEERGVRPILRFLAGFSSLMVLLSGSVAAMLALAIGIVSWLGLRAGLQGEGPLAKGGWRRSPAFAGGLILLSLGSWAFSAPLSRLLEKGLFWKEGELSLPLLWKAGVAQFLENPLLGTGSRTALLYGRQYREGALGLPYEEAEFLSNDYLQCLAEYGLVGLGLGLLVLSLHLYHAGRQLRKSCSSGDPEERMAPLTDSSTLLPGAMASLLAMATLAFFASVWHVPILLVLGAALLSLLARVSSPRPRNAPKSRALRVQKWRLWAQRALVGAVALLLTVSAGRYARSESHFEKARVAFAENPSGYEHLPHLKAARELDPKNPWTASLSAHAQIAGILPEMPEPVRRQALEQAEGYFAQARLLCERDVFAAIGHASVLDELGRSEEALIRLQEARHFAPLYGNLLLAEAAHHLRHGRLEESERLYTTALTAPVFPNRKAALRGLGTVAEGKRLASRQGRDWRISSEGSSSGTPSDRPEPYRRLPEAKRLGRELSGQSPGMTPKADSVAPIVEAGEDPETSDKLGID